MDEKPEALGAGGQAGAVLQGATMTWDEKFYLALLNSGRWKNNLIHKFHRGAHYHVYMTNGANGEVLRWDFGAGTWRSARPRVARAYKMALFGKGLLS